MPISIVRSESHELQSNHALRVDVARTIAFYRRVVRMVCTVAMTHWHELGSLRSNDRQMALEALFHPTKLRPTVRYPMIAKVLGQMPSYLRRAAIHHAQGAVESFMSNWSNWLGGKIGGKQRETGSRTPRLGLPRVFPSLYGGNMITYGEQLKTVRIKLLGSDGQWRFSDPIRLKGRFKRLLPLAGKMDLSPSLVLRGSKVSLSCPVGVQPPSYLTNKALIAGAHRVCAIDVGINTAATAAIVDTTGTVIARKFFTCGRHNDQRDRLAAVIADKQSQSGTIRRGKRFCKDLHRRIAGISLDAARTLARDLAEFAAQHGAKVFVIEDLKGWKPKGPSRKMRARFHRFQHRALVKHLGFKAQEMGMRVLEIFARGTSRWAYDGSGKVVRSKDNAQLATFASGKRYNADLNGALNIAARGLAMILGIKESPKKQASAGKSSGLVARIPLVLADIWAWAAKHRPALSQASNQPISVGT